MVRKDHPRKLAIREGIYDPAGRSERHDMECISEKHQDISWKEDWMARRIIGFILIALGVAGMVVALAADVIGLGVYPGIDWLQQVGAAIGVAVAVAGAWLVISETTKQE
jgi:hypothetical protein